MKGAGTATNVEGVGVTITIVGMPDEATAQVEPQQVPLMFPRVGFEPRTGMEVISFNRP